MSSDTTTEKGHERKKKRKREKERKRGKGGKKGRKEGRKEGRKGRERNGLKTRPAGSKRESTTQPKLPKASVLWSNEMWR